MLPRVTAILVVRNGERWLDRTLTALGASTRPVDTLVIVDAGSSDGSLATPSVAAARTAQATQFVTAPALDFSAAAAAGLHALPPAESDDEWLWLLTADTAPDPAALSLLLGAVEIAPSVAIAGPKVMDPDDPAIIRSYGLSMTRYGATVELVEGELDQAQHDPQTDVLGVAEAGMLVRRSTWESLGGFDPGLPTADAALDFSVRARLAGRRVVRVPSARVSRAKPPEDFGRRKPVGNGARRRIRRVAQLHRRLVYSPAAALPFHWLSLVPIAILRSIGQLLAKRPGAVGGEFAAAFIAAFDGSVARARGRLRRSRQLGWGAIAPLRVGADDMRERRAAQRERATASSEPDLVRASFLGGGIGVVAFAAVLGVIMSWRLLGATVLEGGALLPLDSGIGAIWAQIGWGWRQIGVGFLGAADPFTAVLALFGSLTAWAPSFSLVLLWITALPFAALGAWWCATRLSSRVAPPIIAALLWTLAPPLLISLADGRAGAVIAHLLLPWLVLAALEGVRSWSAAAAAALLFAVIVAAAPTLFPVLLVLLIVWAFSRPRALVRLIGIPIPAIVLWAPLVAGMIRRGTPLAAFADPGAVTPFAEPTGWELLLGRPDSVTATWGDLLSELGGVGILSTAVTALLLAPIAVLALLSIFLPGARRSIPAVLIAVAGLATALAAVHVQVASTSGTSVGLWPAAGLSLYWLGMIGAVTVALDALARAAGTVGGLTALAAAAAVVPALLAPVLGVAAVHAGDGRVVPALVAAEAAQDPGIGTLVLTPQSDGSLGAEIERGQGTLLDDQSALHATRRAANPEEQRLAELAGNLASRSGDDPADDLQHYQLRFVLLPTVADDADVPASAVRQRASDALDANAVLTPVGETAFGSLWRFDALHLTDAAIPDRGPYGVLVLLVQGIVFGAALLLALPTGRRRRRAVTVRSSAEEQATTFDEDSDG